MAPTILGIRFVRGATIFHVHPVDTVQEGVYLAEGQVDGIYDSPVKSTWKTGAFQDGSRQKAYKKLQRDLVLGFHVKETLSTYELNESVFRRLFTYEADRWDTADTPTTLEIETDLSGVRKLDVLMFEQPEFHAAQDPIKDQYGNLIMKLRAGQPMFYEDDVVDTFSDTAASASGFVTVENPTDQIMYHKWVLTRGTWTLPDYQWAGAEGSRAPGGASSGRTIPNIVVSDANGGATVDLDRQNLMFRDANNTNILAQMAGKVFAFPIPPYTPPTELPVAYTAAPTGGAMCQLIQPRRWSRPWGLELPPSSPLTPVPLMTTFQSTGSFDYTIPDFCDTVDIIALGGGGGGGNGGFITGEGGLPGAWASATIHRGTTIPWATTVLSGAVGTGGPVGTQGSLTFASATGTGVLVSAAGGAAASWGGHVAGKGAGSTTVNGRTFRGGADSGNPGAPGTLPGGGGAGGWPFSPGGAGGRGQIWFYAYQAGS